MSDKTTLINDAATGAVEWIIRGTIGRGLEPTDALIALESTVVGAILAITKLGGDERVLEAVIDGARGRLAETRLNTTPSHGSA